MNDELPFALGYSPSLTQWVIARPYRDDEPHSTDAGAQTFGWALSVAFAGGAAILAWVSGAWPV